MCATFQHWQFVKLQEEGIVGCPGAGEVVGPGKGRAAWGRGRERQEGGFGGGGTQDPVTCKGGQRRPWLEQQKSLLSREGIFLLTAYSHPSQHKVHIRCLIQAE